MPTLSIQLAASTDKGLRRTGNEDTFGVFEIPSCEAAFVVCDGMGGLHAGDLAANEAVRVIEATLRELLVTSLNPSQALLEALRRANDAVNALARPGVPLSEDPTIGEQESASSNAFMGTTAVVGVVREGALHIAHAGDSRGYLLRNDTLSPLTEDHSFVAEQVKLGNLSEAEARVSRFRNMITRAIGIDKTIQPEVREEALNQGDIVLVCSDGLTTMLDDDEIHDVLSTGGSLELRVQLLIDAANRKGGHDNITVLLLAAGSSSESVARIVEKRGGGVPAPERQRERERGEAPRGDSSGRRRSSSRKSASPMMAVLAALGATFVAGLFALALSDGLRGMVGEKLLKSRAVVPTVGLDYASLKYDETPVKVVDSPLARRAPLAVLEDGAVAYITNSEAQIVRVRGKTKEVLVNDIKVPDKQNSPAEVPDDEVYLAGDPQGNTYISLTRRGVIKKLSPKGEKLAVFEKLDLPGALAVDPKTGDIYFIDGKINNICVFRVKKADPKK